MTFTMTVGNDSYCPLLKFNKFVKINFTSISPYAYAIKLGRMKLKYNEGYVIYDIVRE